MSNQHDYEQEGEVVIKERVKRPARYKALMHNDDYTAMVFVIYILKSFFNKSEEEAHQIMLRVHHEGVGLCGVYTREVAETKVRQVMDAAESEGHPLKCSYERE